jgi:hypothetical protein
LNLNLHELIWAQYLFKVGGSSVDALDHYAKWIHVFAEGPNCFLSGMKLYFKGILAICLSTLLEKIDAFSTERETLSA